MNLIRELKAFRGVRMNLDVAPAMAEPNHTKEIFNMVEDASSGRLVNMRGFENVLLKDINSGFTLSQGTNTCIGTCQDIETSSIIYFLHNDRTNHGIMQMFTDDYSCRWILRDEPLLNFQLVYKVKANVIGGMLFWTDGYFGSFLNSDYNPPRKVNIEKAVKYTDRYYGRWTFSNCVEAYQHTNNPDYEGYTAFLSNIAPGAVPASIVVGDKVVSYARDGINRVKEVTGYGEVLDTGFVNGMFYVVTTRPWQFTDDDIALSGHMLIYEADMYFGIDWQVMDRVKHPPTQAPGVSYVTDIDNKTNFVKGNVYQFRSRYIYDDREKSVWSDISKLPLPEGTETGSGVFVDDRSIDNSIWVWVETGPEEVTSIEIAARTGNDGNWKIIKEISKFDVDGNVLSGITDDINVLYKFYNDTVSTTLDQEDTERLYDFVPQISRHQEIIEKNRIVDANYTEGYDHTNIDVVLSHRFSQIQFEKFDQSFIFTGAIGPSLAVEEVNFIVGSYFLQIWYNVYSCNFSSLFGQDRLFYLELYNEYVQPVVVSTYIHTDETYSEFITRLCAIINAIPPNQNSQYWNGYSLAGVPIYEFKAYTFDGVTINVSCRSSVEATRYRPDPSPYPENLNARIYSLSEIRKPCFKSGAYHYFGVTYFDRAGRSDGVNISDSSEIYIPYFTEFKYSGESPGFDITKAYNYAYLKWEINTKPPEWAVKYQWSYAGSNIGYFIDFSIPATSIVRVTPIGEIPYVSMKFNAEIVEARRRMKNYVIEPYVWQKGDRIRFSYIDEVTGDNYYFTENYTYEILGVIYLGVDSDYQRDNSSGQAYILDSNGNKVLQDGESLLMIENFDLNVIGINMTQGASNTQKVGVEIFRLNNIDKGERIYYGIGPFLDIINPHTNYAMHSKGDDGIKSEIANDQTDTMPATGYFTVGDCYFKSRYNGKLAFPVEAYQFSDYYKSDYYEKRRPNAVFPYFKRITYVSKLIYSGKLIQNTRVNEISRVVSADSVELQDKYGPINSIEEVGDVLKVIQKSKVSGLYIGRAGITTPNEEGAQVMSSTKDVLGTLIVSKSSYGTVHSLSIKRNETRLYGFDFHAAAIWRDAGNGVQNISDHYGVKTFIKSACDIWGMPENVDVISGYDYQNEMVWMTFTGTGLSFTIGFRDTAGRNSDGFALFAAFSPQMYGEAKATITSFENNALWLHNSDNVARCNFYGVQYGYYVTVILNQSPAEIKRFKQIGVTSNAPVACPEIIIEPNENYPFGQQTILTAEAFTSVRGKYVADFGRNMLTSGDTTSYDDLINGDDMEGNAMTVKIQGSETTEHKIFTVEAEEIV